MANRTFKGLYLSKLLQKAFYPQKMRLSVAWQMFCANIASGYYVSKMFDIFQLTFLIEIQKKNLKHLPLLLPRLPELPLDRHKI